MTPAPTRLFVLLASESDFALVLRRGPAKYVAAIGWDRTRDKFKLGQWLKARINGCDLSPDGRHFLYRASKYDPKEGGIVPYTVMSRAPYWTALHYWAPKHWVHGGGFFDNTRFWLVVSGTPEMRTLPHFARVKEAPELETQSIYPDTETWRRERDGWVLQPDDYQRRKRWFKSCSDLTLSCSVFNRRDSKPDFYELLQGAENTVVTSGKWDWADLDIPRKRLCFAQGGQLWSLALKTGAEPILLHDFSDMKFEQRVAPY